MKIELRKLPNEGVCPFGYALTDERGKLLPGQVKINVVTEAGSVGKIIVEFQIADGDDGVNRSDDFVTDPRALWGPNE